MTVGKGAAAAQAFQQGARSPPCSRQAPQSLDRASLAQPPWLSPAKRSSPKVASLTALEGPKCRLFASPQDTGAACAARVAGSRSVLSVLLLILETTLLSFWSLSFNDG